MRKIIICLISLLFTFNAVEAESIHKTLQNLGVNKSSVSVSVKDVKSGNVVFKLNERTPRNPASTLKIVTTCASVNQLGADYVYKTSLYKSTNNDLYLKLSADPLLTSNELEAIITTARNKEIAPKTFYVDDTAFDRVEWGEGWQWDDELNVLMPKFSVYNINRNLLRIEVAPSTQSAPGKITVRPFYPLTFINNTVTNFKATSSLDLQKDESIADNMYQVSGVVAKLTNLTMPVPNPKINFILRLENAINSTKLEYFNKIAYAKLPDINVYLVDEVKHPIDVMLVAILKNSNNMIAETLYKTAGAVWANGQGNIANSTGMLEDYLSRMQLNTDDIKIVDGSGVSKNNLMTSEFMTNFLENIANNDNFEAFRMMLPAPGEGTLKNRMLYFKDNLRAKTGTLSDSSAIAGYLMSRSGKLYAFDIMINDAKTTSADKKNIEEQILRNVYLNY